MLPRLIIWPLILAATGAVLLYRPPTVCESALAYSIGRVDERFEITSPNILSALQRAEEIWEEPTGYNLFEHSPNSALKVNFIFDERQNAAIEQNKLAGLIDADKATYDKLAAEFDRKRSSYEARLSQYSADVAQYNAQGGAPPNEFNRLERERIELNKLASELNSLAGRLNAIAGRLNLKVDQFNANVGEPFNAAEYTSRAINVFQFDSQNDLIIKLAHEFGHTLNIEHVDDAKAIMNGLLKDQNLDSPALVQADIDALNQQCTQKPNLYQIFRGKIYRQIGISLIF